MAAILIRRRSANAPAIDSPAADSGRIEQMLERGAPLAFVAGIVLNLFPGFFPLIALKDIAELDEGFATTVALVLGFYVIMFALIEVPLVGYLVAPAWTAQATARLTSGCARMPRGSPPVRSRSWASSSSSAASSTSSCEFPTALDTRRGGGRGAGRDSGITGMVTSRGGRVVGALLMANRQRNSTTAAPCFLAAPSAGAPAATPACRAVMAIAARRAGVSQG